MRYSEADLTKLRVKAVAAAVVQVKIPKKDSMLERKLSQQLHLIRLPFEREVKLIDKRRYRVDFLIAPRIVVECEGGIHSGGRHTRGGGFTSDCEKYNLLAIAGYVVLRVTHEQIDSGAALKWIEAARARFE